MGAYLPGSQASLEAEWKRELWRLHGIRFDALYCITNMPISRFLEWLIDSGNLEAYMERLVAAFNPAAVSGLMCRNTLSVGWDGQLYDCDFNQMLDLAVARGAPRHIRDFQLRCARGSADRRRPSLFRLHGRRGLELRRRHVEISTESGGAMSTDAKDITRRFYEEIINQKNVHAIDRFCTADFVDHNPPPGGKGSLDATKQQFLELVAAFPDLKMMVQDQIAEGDRVVNRVLVRGTHKGEYMGIPGSGKTVEIGGIDILRMVNGKAAERWGYFDDVKLMQQLGAMPGPKQ